MDPDSDDVAAGPRGSRRDYEKTVRVPADLAAEMTPRHGARPAGLAGGARAPTDFSPLPRRARAPVRAAPPLRRLLRRLRAPLRRAARRLRARPHDRRAAAAARRAARRRSCRSCAAAGDAEQPRNDGIFARRLPGRRAGGARAPGKCGGARLRLRSRAPRREERAPLLHLARHRATRASPRATTPTASPTRSSGCCTRPGTPSTRQGLTPASATGTRLRRGRLAGRPRVAVAPLGEPRRPLEVVLGAIFYPKAQRAFPGTLRRREARGTSSRDQRRGALGDPRSSRTKRRTTCTS